MNTLTCGCGNILLLLPDFTEKEIDCPKCGKTLSIPAVPEKSDPIEPALLEETPDAGSVPAPLSKDREHRVGKLAVKMGLLRGEDLEKAVEELAAARADGQSVRLGELLVQRGHITADDLQRVLKTQEKRPYRCPGCNRTYNVAGLSQGRGFRCRYCDSLISEKNAADAVQVDESFYVPKPGAAPADEKPSLPPDAIPGYRIESRIGSGNLGDVYRAVQESMQRPVAIRVLPPEGPADQVFVARFLEEARSVARLLHDNIISTIDCGQSGERTYLVMEHVEGETVAERLARQKVIPEREALFLVRQVAEGLEHARAGGILHGDVKPSNILVNAEGRVKIRDLGITQPLATEPSRMLRNLLYASPERLHDQPVDHRSDIYSLGATLYEMLTGQPPFMAHRVSVLVTKHATEAPAAPQRLNPTLSDPAQRLILTMLAKDSARRPQSYPAIVKAIDRMLTARPPTSVQAAKRLERQPPARKKPLPVGALIAGIAGGLALVVALIVIVMGARGEEGRGNDAPRNGKRKPPPKKETVKKPDGKTVEPAPKAMHRQTAKRKLNLMAIAATYCDYKARYLGSGTERERAFEEALRIRASMADLLERVGRSTNCLQPSDRIIQLSGTDLGLLSDKEATRALGLFLANLKANSSAEVVFKRGSSTYSLEIVFGKIHPDFRRLMEVADVIPEQD